MKIIDAHLHFSKIQSFIDTAKKKSFVNYSDIGLKQEFADNNIVLGIAMGLEETQRGAFPDDKTSNPMGIDLEKNLPDNLVYCLGINPFDLIKNKKNSLSAIEKATDNVKVVGLKIYAGYYPFFVYDEVYQPVYELAATYKLPIVIHSGDTYSERGVLKYSHPLTVDELAVKHRNINFIIAHQGDPWIMDCAEVVAKNRNVFADMSGLIVGNASDIRRFQEEPLFFNHIKRGTIYTDNYSKYLFGTDWPLVKTGAYLDFIKAIIPEKYHNDVFYNNALNVFPKINQFLER